MEQTQARDPEAIDDGEERGVFGVVGVLLPPERDLERGPELLYLWGGGAGAGGKAATAEPRAGGEVTRGAERRSP